MGLPDVEWCYHTGKRDCETGLEVMCKIDAKVGGHELKGDCPDVEQQAMELFAPPEPLPVECELKEEAFDCLEEARNKGGADAHIEYCKYTLEYDTCAPEGVEPWCKAELLVNGVQFIEPCDTVE